MVGVLPGWLCRYGSSSRVYPNSFKPAWGAVSINRPESPRSSRMTTRHEYIHVRSTAAIPGRRPLSSSNCENLCNY